MKGEDNLLHDAHVNYINQLCEETAVKKVDLKEMKQWTWEDYLDVKSFLEELRDRTDNISQLRRILREINNEEEREMDN